MMKLLATTRLRSAVKSWATEKKYLYAVSDSHALILLPIAYLYLLYLITYHRRVQVPSVKNVD